MSDRLGRFSLISLGIVVALIVLAVVPLSPAMIHPLYWQLTGLLSEEPLRDLETRDVSDRACPMVTGESIKSVAGYRNGVWVFEAPKSLFMQCSDHRISYLAFSFDTQSSQCSAEAGISPICDF